MKNEARLASQFLNSTLTIAVHRRPEVQELEPWTTRASEELNGIMLMLNTFLEYFVMCPSNFRLVLGYLLNEHLTKCRVYIKDVAEKGLQTKRKAVMQMSCLMLETLRDPGLDKPLKAPLSELKAMTYGLLDKKAEEDDDSEGEDE